MKNFIALVAFLVFSINTFAQSVDGVVTHATCGLPNGAIDVWVTGGVSPFTYQWSNGANTQDISGLNAGTYIVTVTGANGGSSVKGFQVNQSGGNPPAAWITGANLICGGGTTTLAANGNGTYMWSTGSTNSQISVGPGMYFLTVTNASGCTAMASVSVGLAQPPNATISGNLNICTGSNTTLTGNGGGTYIWSTGSVNQQINVGPGTYFLTVTNASGCTAVTSATVNAVAGISPTVTGTCDGAQITGLTAGTYTVTITNASGCTATATFNVGGALQTWFQDSDNDGFGNSAQSIQSCVQPQGYVLQGGDCNNANPTVYPGAQEICDGLDNNCDGVIPSNELDADSDGWSICEGDCNDWNANMYPGATEVADGQDNDCDGQVDEGTNPPCPQGIMNNMGVQYGETFCPTNGQFFLTAPTPAVPTTTYTWSQGQMVGASWQALASTDPGTHSYWVVVDPIDSDPVQYCFEYTIDCDSPTPVTDPNGGEEGVLLYPNPTDGQVTIERGGEQSQFDATGLPSGIYNVTDMLGRFVGRFVRK